MNAYLTQLVQLYRQQGLLLDTNILLLYFVGSLNRLHVAKHKRTRGKYSAEDFDLLSSLLKIFQNRIITTPNILTEASNLLGDCSSSDQEQLWKTFVAGISILEEKYLPSNRISQTPMFSKFGLTDSAIIELVKDKYLVLTDDVRLFQYLENTGIDVLNFTHIRTNLIE